MTNPSAAVPMQLIREMALVKQGLVQRPASKTREDLLRIIRRIGLLQLDSISVTARSHYLVMLSRAGLYDVAELDVLLDEHQLFEYWAHAACMIPMEDYAYFLPKIKSQRDGDRGRCHRLSNDAEDILNQVLEAIRENGAMSSKDFEAPRRKGQGWWNWKPAKAALECLFDRGELMVTRREKFQRYYDLPQRVLNGVAYPVDKTLDDYRRWALIAGLRSQGIGTFTDTADYYRLNKPAARPVMADLVASGEVHQMEVEGLGTEVFIHRDDVPLLDSLSDSPQRSELTMFLSPFDNLIWHRPRTEMVFNFYYRVEMYTPAAKRVYGYYVLPLLHRGELVGRIDPKIDRKNRRFIIRALHLEDGVTFTDDLLAGFVGAVREFMEFHDCEDFVLELAPSASIKKQVVSALKKIG